jgi:magnesium chelatase family protein
VTAVQYDDLADNSSLRPISSEEMRMQVNLARRFRSNRGQKIETFMLNPDEIKEFCKMSEAAEIILRRYFEKFGIGARSYHKILKIARTIADVSQKELIDEESIRQAIFFRVLDKAL